MLRRTQEESWTWTPAEGAIRGRAIGAVVLAATCLMAGVLLGRLSVAEIVPNVAQRQAPPATASEPMRDAPIEKRPSLALGSEPEQKEPGESAAPSAPAVVLLNPGKANGKDESARTSNISDMPGSGPRDGGGKAPSTRGLEPKASTAIDADKARDGKQRWQRALAKGPAGRSSQQPARRSHEAPSASRDYQDLRDYMLAR